MSKIRVNLFGLQFLRPVTSIVRNLPSLPSWNDQILPHNWMTSFTIETAYMTTISASREEQVEERRAMRDRPIRTVSVQFSSIPTEKLEKMLHLMRNMSEARFAVPIYCDLGELANYDKDGADNKTLETDTRFRRYFRGAYVAVLKDSDVALRKVTAMTESSLEIDSALPWNFSAGEAVVMPCLVADQLLDSQIELLTDEVGHMAVQLGEAVAEYALPSSWTGLPEAWNSFEGYPIFDPMFYHQWSQSLKIEEKRAGIHTALGRGFYTETWGSAPKRITDVALLQDREGAYKFLQLFDSRRGRLLPLWLIDAQGGWKVKEVGSGYVDVYARGDISYLNEVKYLGLTDKSGYSEVREVGTVSEVNGDWRFNLTSSFTISASNVVHCARARLSRFQKDAISQEAITDNVIMTRASFIELLKEVNE